MAVSETAQRNHDELFPGHVSTLKATDPELIEVFGNFAFDEVLQHCSLDIRTRLVVQLAALIGCQAISEYRVMLGAALTIGVTPVEAREIVYQAVPYATNLTGSIQLIRAALPQLRAQGGGRIIQVSSYGGQVAFPGNSLYHATKWHRGGVLQRTGGRRGHPPLRHRPAGGLHRDQGLDQRLRLRRDPARLRQERQEAGSGPDRPADPDQPLPTSFDRTIAAYKAFEHLLADGRVRAIGVSNFMPEHLAHLLDASGIVPAVNQVELHERAGWPIPEA